MVDFAAYIGPGWGWVVWYLTQYYIVLYFGVIRYLLGGRAAI